MSANTKIKLGDFVTITSFHPDSAWKDDLHLIGIVYEATEVTNLGYQLKAVNENYKSTGFYIDDEIYAIYPAEFFSLCNVEKLI